MYEDEIMAEQVVFAGDKRLDEVILELKKANSTMQATITALTNRVKALEDMES